MGSGIIYRAPNIQRIVNYIQSSCGSFFYKFKHLCPISMCTFKVTPRHVSNNCSAAVVITINIYVTVMIRF